MQLLEDNTLDESLKDAKERKDLLKQGKKLKLDMFEVKDEQSQMRPFGLMEAKVKSTKPKRIKKAKVKKYNRTEQLDLFNDNYKHSLTPIPINLPLKSYVAGSHNVPTRMISEQAQDLNIDKNEYLNQVTPNIDIQIEDLDDVLLNFSVNENENVVDANPQEMIEAGVQPPLKKLKRKSRQKEGIRKTITRSMA